MTSPTSSQHYLSPGYVAGLVDGEGWVGLDTARRLCVQVEMTDPGSVLALRETFAAGSVQFSPARTPNNRSTYKWRAYGAAAISVLAYCRDYLIVKRPHADTLLRWWESREDQDYHYVRRLNKRGGYAERSSN